MTETMNVQSVAINLNNYCNLSCSYCFVSKSSVEMSIDTLIMSNLFLSSHQVSDISFFGTEPLLSLKLLSLWIPTLRGDAERTISKISLTTNGTLIDPAFASFAKKYDIDLLVSCDGDEYSHNLFRSRWQDTIQGIRHLNDAGIRPFILVSVTPETLPYLPHNLVYLDTNYSISGLAANLVTSHHATQFQTSELRKYLTMYYEEVVSMGIGEHYWNKVLPFLQDPDRNMTRRTCGACQQGIGIDWDGRIYPCHKTGWTQAVGDVWKGIDKELYSIVHDFDYQKCHHCVVRFCAPCYEENFWSTGDPLVINDYTCKVEAVRWEVVSNVYKEYVDDLE